MRSLPSLGARGEGWFLMQILLFAAIAAAGGIGPVWSGWLRGTSVALGALAICLGATLSLRGVLDLRENLTPFPRPLPGARLVDTGAYRFVRHPIYGGLILGALGWGLATASIAALAAAVVLLLFFNLKSRREEMWLDDQFPDYGAYRSRTRRLLPWIY